MTRVNGVRLGGRRLITNGYRLSSLARSRNTTRDASRGGTLENVIRNGRQLIIAISRNLRTEKMRMGLRVRALLSVAVPTIVVAACFAMTPPPAGYLAEPQQFSATLSATPAEIVTAATAVLSEWGFGIATADQDMGVVQGTELTVQETWHGAIVREYVYCGKAYDSGVEYALSNPVTLNARIVARPQGDSTIVRLNINGTSCSVGMVLFRPRRTPVNRPPVGG